MLRCWNEEGFARFVGGSLAGRRHVGVPAGGIGKLFFEGCSPSLLWDEFRDLADGDGGGRLGA